MSCIDTESKLIKCKHSEGLGPKDKCVCESFIDKPFGTSSLVLKKRQKQFFGSFATEFRCIHFK